MFELLVFLLLYSLADSIQIGQIENNILIGSINTSLVNVTRDECLCQMITSNIFAANYYQINNTCVLFNYNSSSIWLKLNTNASFLFVNQSSMFITDIQSSVSVINALWSFDGDLNDRDLNYKGTLMNNASFYRPGITGYGSALCFNANLNQSVSIDPTTNLNISFKSFTFEYWIYPFSLSTGDRGMVGQCQSLTANRCLHMTLRNGKVRISFFSNPCDGTTNITINKWYHLTFVYYYSSSTQLTYINGIPECTHTSSAPLQITNLSYIPLTIGMTYPLGPYYFDGLIDQLSLVAWAKNASEILNDATLVAWYSFTNSYNDFGPNGINGLGMNTVLKNNSLLFNTTQSYFQSSGFVLLGIDNNSYSLSIWINPFQTNASTILHIYQNSSTNSTWCSAYLGFTSQGEIQAQSQSGGGFINVLGPSISTSVWTHIVQTYSLTHGISLYINGSLFNRSSSCDYRSGSTPLTIRLGSSFNDGNQTCVNTTNQDGQYSGWMDEFRIYSRELTVSDVQTLAIR